MNARQKDIAYKLFQDAYIRPVRSKGNYQHRLYIGNQIPLFSIHSKDMKLLSLWLTKKQGKLVISRRLVQQEDGRRAIKKIYKRILKSKKALNGGNAN